MQFQVTVRSVRTGRIIERLLYDDQQDADDRIRHWKTSYGEVLWSKQFKIEIKGIA